MTKLDISAVISISNLTELTTQCFANSRNNEAFNFEQRNEFLLQGLQYREILKQLIGQEIEESANNLVKEKKADQQLLEVNKSLKRTQETPQQEFNQTIETLTELADILSQVVNSSSVAVPSHGTVKSPVRANANITEELAFASQTIEPTKGSVGTATPPPFNSKNKLLIQPKGDVAELIRVPRLATNIIPPYAQIPGAATNPILPGIQRPEFATNLISSATSSQPIETVLGRDDRERIRDTENDPWRMICSLAITGPRGNFVGTGWFAGPKTIITAAHCLYEVTQMGGWAMEISIYPGRDDNDFPYQTRSSQFEVPQEWFDSQGRNADYDYGVIHLSEPLGQEIGWFSVAFANDERLKGTRVNISGYPGDLAGNYGAYQLFHADNVPHDGVAPNRFYYTIDTAGGQSGAPVWIELGGDQRQVVGIHTYGFNGVSGRNSATRITPMILNDIKEWIARG